MLRVMSSEQIQRIVGVGWRVLDVGCGDRPFPCATHLVDRRPRTKTLDGLVKTENPTLSVVNHGRPLVFADIESLPFRDKSFDLVIASHVIEHAEDPDKALAELKRVAPRGYIECPRAWFEIIDSSPFHRWLIDFTGDELLFRRKTKDEEDFAQKRRLHDVDPELFGHLYGCVFKDTDPFGISLEKNFCHICIYWEDNIPFRILPSSKYR